MKTYSKKQTPKCEHEWREVESQYNNEYSTVVECIHCNMCGEKTNETGEVYWPAT